MNSVARIYQKIKILLIVGSIIVSATGFAMTSSTQTTTKTHHVAAQPASLTEALDYSLRHGFHSVDWTVL